MIPEQQDPSSCDKSETVVYVVYFHGELRVPINPCHSDIDDDQVPDTMSIYTIHALHVEDDSSHSHRPLPPPVLTLRPHDLPQLMGFGCLGSSIYMIGGRWDVPSSNRGPSLDVYILDTHRLPSTEYPPGNRNSLAYLRKGPKLNAPKILPIVIALLGKLYVLPESFDPSYNKEHHPGACIEVLDPDSNEWAALPEPILDPHDFSTPHDYNVQSFDVVESCIVLTLVRGLVYVLDGNHPFEGWKKSSRLDWLPVLHANWRTGGSEVVDGLWYPWFGFPSYHHGASYLVAYDLAQEKGEAEIIPVRRPRHGKGIRKIYSGQRRVMDCGGGKAAIFSGGPSKWVDLTTYGYGNLRFNLDVVRLEKKITAGKSRKRKLGNLKAYSSINCVPLRSFSYDFGDVGRGGYLCACFAINEMSRNHRGN
ncbi:uncharacterized protein LOC116187899 [Punica granatum]|nr:uncharacterized protein LOC116187899 [Punica granatum]XP_031372768.1 uncharacterized protein LOC116187899 [Punica granatum]